jgi:hypothetical protein
MPGKRAENRKLKDVKAALQSLQRIDLNSSAPIELRHEQPEAKKSPVQGRRLGAFALALIAVGTVIVLASDLFFKYWPPTVPGGQTADIDNKISAPAGGDAGQGNSASGLPLKAAQPAKPQSAVESRTAPPVSAVPDPRIIPVLENARQLMDAPSIQTISLRFNRRTRQPIRDKRRSGTGGGATLARKTVWRWMMQGSSVLSTPCDRSHRVQMRLNASGKSSHPRCSNPAALEGQISAANLRIGVKLRKGAFEPDTAFLDNVGAVGNRPREV